MPKSFLVIRNSAYLLYCNAINNRSFRRVNTSMLIPLFVSGCTVVSGTSSSTSMKRSINRHVGRGTKQAQHVERVGAPCVKQCCTVLLRVATTNVNINCVERRYVQRKHGGLLLLFPIPFIVLALLYPAFRNSDT